MNRAGDKQCGAAPTCVVVIALVYYRIQHLGSDLGN